MKKKTSTGYATEGDKLFAKRALSSCVNIILIVGVCFLLYERGFSTGNKLLLLNISVVASYVAAIALHAVIYLKNPLKEYRWIYILLTLVGMFPYAWVFTI